MAKKKDIENEEFESSKPAKTRIALKQRRKKKEPPKPWGKFERLVVLFVLLATVLTSVVLSLSARNWKLPNLPRISFSNLKNLSLFKEQTIIVGNHGSQLDQERINAIKKEFKEKTSGYSGIYAFYIYDLNGDYFYGVNHQESMQAASLIKLPVMSLSFKKLQNGELEEDEILPLLEAMGQRSDNAAFNEMVEKLGEDKVQQEIDTLGMTSTSLEDNITTPEDIGLFLKKLHNGEILGSKYTNLFLEYLTDTIYEQWITPGIPDDIVVSHKYGRETHSVSDAGVIFATKPFVMVIMTDGVVEREADEVFPELSKLLYDGHTHEISN